MPYIKTNWLDRLVQFPSKFRFTDNGDGTANIEEDPGNVFVAGTPVSAQNLNKIEDALESITNRVDNFPTKASTTQAQEGTDDNTYMTPKKTNDTLRYKNIPSNITDYNQITATGFYYLDSNQSVSLLNAPPGASQAIAFLEVFDRTNASRPTQIFYQGANGHVAIRGSNSNGYRSWHNLTEITSTTEQALAGVDDTTKMTPLKVLQSIKANGLTKYTIPRKTVNSVNFLKIAEVDNSNNTNARLSLMINGIGSYSSNSFGSVIANVSARGGLALDVDVLSETALIDSNLLFLVNNTNINKLELWFRSTTYQGVLELVVLNDNLGNSNVGELASQTTKPPNFINARTINRTGDLSTLTTADKLSLVGAINEINAKTLVKASVAQARTLTDDTTYMTPAKVRESQGFHDVGGKTIDELVTTGRYGLNSNYITENIPPGFVTNSNSLLEVIGNTSNSVFTQILNQRVSGFMWVRHGVTSSGVTTFQPWIRINNNFASQTQTSEGTAEDVMISPFTLNRSMRYRDITSVTDLNNLDQVGRYFYNSNNVLNLVNRPDLATGQSTVIEVSRRTSADYVVQHFYQIDSGFYAVRAKSGSTWSSWVPISRNFATTAQSLAGTSDNVMMSPLGVSQFVSRNALSVSDIITSETDLNTLINNGMHHVDVSGTLPLNAPTAGSMIGNFLVFVTRPTTANRRVSQLFLSYVDNKIFYRSRNTNGNWLAWREITGNEAIGVLGSLNTTNKSDLVSAINEVNTLAKDAASRYGVYPTIVTNWNNANNSGQYMSSPQATTNGPSGVTSWLMGEVFAHNAQFAKQVVRELTGNREWERRKENGVWTAWVETSPQTLFTSVSNGKSAIAGALTDKGVPTAGDATFDTMAQNIRNIETGKQAFIFRTAGSTSQFIELGFRPEIVIFRASLPNSTSQIQQTYIDPALSNFQTGYNRLQSSIGGAVGYADVDIFPNGLTIHNLTPGMNYQLFAFQGVIPEGSFSSNPGVVDRPIQI